MKKDPLKTSKIKPVGLIKIGKDLKIPLKLIKKSDQKRKK